MEIRQITLKRANEFVNQNHRHHGKVQGHKFSIAAYNNNEICGVAIVGHPQGRYSNDGRTLEVVRLCTDGTKNACSLLYGRCARIARDFGYKKIITYILESENGSSLKASGWVLENEKCGKPNGWNGRNRDSDKYKQLCFDFVSIKEPPKEYKKLYVKKL